METQFVNPNLHVVLVHFPLALLVVGTLIETFGFLWRRHSFGQAGRWMILLGALGSIPTVLTGIHALYDVANPTNVSEHWSAIASQSALDEHQWELLEDHLLLASIGTGLSLLAGLGWLAASDVWRRRFYLPLLGMLLVGVGLILAAAWHGGEAVYTHGVGVAHHATPGTTQPTLTYFVPPLQTHMIFAGWAIAVALAGLALSVRQITQGAADTQIDFIAAALGPPPTLIGGNAPDTLQPEPRDVAMVRLPVARFWLLAALLLLLTAAGGLWVLATGAETWSLPQLWNDIIRQNPRQLAHTINGDCLVVVALFFAAAAKWAPQRKWLVLALAILLLASVALQAWLGILLMYDTPAGSLWRFN